MQHQALGALIGRLEKSAAANPLRYRISALAVAALGFGILGMAIGFAVIPVAALAALIGVIALKGAWAPFTSAHFRSSVSGRTSGGWGSNPCSFGRPHLQTIIEDR